MIFSIILTMRPFGELASINTLVSRLSLTLAGQSTCFKCQKSNYKIFLINRPCHLPHMKRTFLITSPLSARAYNTTVLCGSLPLRILSSYCKRLNGKQCALSLTDKAAMTRLLLYYTEPVWPLLIVVRRFSGLRFFTYSYTDRFA